MAQIHEKIKRIAQLQTELTTLQTQVDAEQSRCTHIWNAPEYSPEFKMQPTGFRGRGQGSHYWTEPTDYERQEVPRWERVCRQCGFTEYTHKQGIPKHTPQEPQFD